MGSTHAELIGRPGRAPGCSVMPATAPTRLLQPWGTNEVSAWSL